MTKLHKYFYIIMAFENFLYKGKQIRSIYLCQYL